MEQLKISNPVTSIKKHKKRLKKQNEDRMETKESVMYKGK